MAVDDQVAIFLETELQGISSAVAGGRGHRGTWFIGYQIAILLEHDFDAIGEVDEFSVTGSDAQIRELEDVA